MCQVFQFFEMISEGSTTGLPVELAQKSLYNPISSIREKEMRHQNTLDSIKLQYYLKNWGVPCPPMGRGGLYPNEHCEIFRREPCCAVR